MRPYRGLTKEGKEVKGWYVLSNDKHYIIDCYGVTGTALVLADTISDLPGYHEVIPETVGQFVCKDKTGKDVFAGDRIGRSIAGKLCELGIVEFKRFQWCVKRTIRNTVRCYYDKLEAYYPDIELIEEKDD